MCAEPLLATVWFEPVADVVGGLAVGYRACPRFPLEGAAYEAWLLAAERHGYRARFAAATLSAVLNSRPRVPAETFLTFAIDATSLSSEAVSGVLKGAGDLSRVVLEVTRLEPSRDHRPLVHIRDALGERGAMVAVAATGPGHADALQIADIAPDFLTAGPELIAGIDVHPRRASALSALDGFARQLGARLMAAGITTETELSLIRDLRIPLAHGPLIGRAREQVAELKSGARNWLGDSARERREALARLSDLVGAMPSDPDIPGETALPAQY